MWVLGGWITACVNFEPVLNWAADRPNPPVDALPPSMSEGGPCVYPFRPGQAEIQSVVRFALLKGIPGLLCDSFNEWSLLSFKSPISGTSAPVERPRLKLPPADLPPPDRARSKLAALRRIVGSPGT